MKGVTSRPSSCSVIKAPPPYSSCLAASSVGRGLGVDTALGGAGYTLDDDDGKSSRRRSRGVCARSPGSAPPPSLKTTRRYKRPSSGVEHARRHHQHQQLQQQSYVSLAAQRQLSPAVSDCPSWPCVVDSAYPGGVTDYAAAAAACQDVASSCRYQATVRPPPYRHDLLAVVPAIGPGETGPAAERLKQMAAHYQRLADNDSCGGGGASAFGGCYDERYSYHELYDEFAAQCQRFAVQPSYQQASVYYDAAVPGGYAPMLTAADPTHSYLTNGVSQPPSSNNTSSHSQFAVAEPEALSASHVTPAQFSYNGGGLSASTVGAGYGGVGDGSSRYMSPCAAHQTTTSTTSMPLHAAPTQAPAMTSSSSSSSSCQATLASTAGQTANMQCFESQQQSSVSSFLDIYPTPPLPAASVKMSLISSVGSSTTSSQHVASRRVSTSSTSVPAVSGRRSSWSMSADCADGGTATWLSTVQSSDGAGVRSSPDVDAATSSRAGVLDSAELPLPPGQYNGGGLYNTAAAAAASSAKPLVVVDAELFSHRQSSCLGGIELY